jgi:hypothetical protein
MKCSVCQQEGHIATNIKFYENNTSSLSKIKDISMSDSIQRLYGFNSTNSCDKDYHSEKVVNGFLPISVGIFSETHNIPIILCNSRFVLCKLEKCFYEDSYYDTEKVCIHPNFIHGPPNDICITQGDKSVFYETKVVKSKGVKTEIILRQDCYAFNCLQSILLNNSSKKYKNIEDLLNDISIVENPYLWMLLWDKNDAEEICFDCIVFTDVSIIRMVKDANTERTKEAIKLINQSLFQYETTGNMKYKDKKTSTVAHQKVSLFPIRDIESIKNHIFKFCVKSTDIVLQNVRSDINLWHEIEKNKLMNKINNLNEEIGHLKKLCDELQ